MTILIILGIVYFVFWRLHTNYIAVMALRDARDAKKLTLMDKLFGYPTLIEGLIEDMIGNLILTFVLFEFPKEFTVTARTRRLAKLPADSKGLKRWQRAFSRWMLGQLAHHDKKGGHDVPEVS
jgi:hypothetical protein